MSRVKCFLPRIITRARVRNLSVPSSVCHRSRVSRKGSQEPVTMTRPTGPVDSAFVEDQYETFFRHT